MTADEPGAVDLRKLRIETPDTPPRRGRGLRALALVVVVAAAFAGGYLVRGHRAAGVSGRLAVRVVTLRAQSAAGGARAALTEGGWIEVPSYHPIVVSALVPGRVDELLVLEGTRVEKGQVIARLYAKDLDDRLRRMCAALQEAEARLALLEAGYRSEEVARARAEHAGRVQAVALADKVLARTRRLLPAGAASEEDVERDAAALEIARFAERAAAEEVRRLEAGYRKEEIAEARAAVARAQAERDLAAAQRGYADVRSPAAGVVLERFVTPGSRLDAADPRVVSLYDPNDLQARVDVRQEHAGRVRVGARAAITTEAEPGRTYPGTVIRVEPLANLKKNTVQAKVRIDEPGPGLHPEMICRVRFLDAVEADEADRGTLWVPRTALGGDIGRRHVFVVRDGRAHRVAVGTGTERENLVEVRSGLAPGARIVVSPPPDLADGCEVEERP